MRSRLEGCSLDVGPLLRISHAAGCCNASPRCVLGRTRTFQVRALPASFRGSRFAAGADDLLWSGPMTRAREAMVAEPATLEASASAVEAGERLSQPDVRAVLVTDADGAL